MIEMAKVKVRYEAKGKPLTEAGLMRVASYEVKGYWRNYFRELNGTDCGRCSKAQRQKCRGDELQSQCPKYRELISLDTDIDDGDGDKVTFAEFIADDKAIDLDAWLDANAILHSLPKRLIQIGYKRYVGIPLERKEQTYLNHWQKNKQKPYFRVRILDFLGGDNSERIKPLG